mmetsp:Transcript_49732/g.98342  ORF Transcript_49732/g.98342 Transcript_49732/m.98342 type:complete len:224 (+) Transcript_49732:188-859(+)
MAPVMAHRRSSNPSTAFVASSVHRWNSKSAWCFACNRAFFSARSRFGPKRFRSSPARWSQRAFGTHAASLVLKASWTSLLCARDCSKRYCTACTCRAPLLSLSEVLSSCAASCVTICLHNDGASLHVSSNCFMRASGAAANLVEAAKISSLNVCTASSKESNAASSVRLVDKLSPGASFKFSGACEAFRRSVPNNIGIAPGEGDLLGRPGSSDGPLRERLRGT